MHSCASAVEYAADELYASLNATRSDRWRKRVVSHCTVDRFGGHVAGRTPSVDAAYFVLDWWIAARADVRTLDHMGRLPAAAVDHQQPGEQRELLGVADLHRVGAVGAARSAISSN